MDLLPVEVLSHTLSLCHLRQVCRSMSVSRKWEAAARSAIRSRKSLTLVADGTDAPIETEETVSPDRVLFGDGSIVNCLLQTRSLSLLVCRVTGTRAIDRIILNNASTLRILEIAGDLPFDEFVVYRNLRQLTCPSIDERAITACPVLRKLNLTCQESVFELMNPVTMQELKCRVISLNNHTGVPDLVSGLSKLINLRKLDLTIGCTDWSDPCHSLRHLFDTFTQLNEVRLNLGNEEVCLDVAVAALARHNPGLQLLHLKGITLTDDALISLSRLTNLMRLVLDTEEAVFSMDAILTLLRGGSRTRFQKWSIWHQPETDWAVVESEIQLMGQESGRTLRVRKGGDWIRFKY